MLICNLVTVFLTAISLFFSFQVSKSLTSYIFDEIFVPATNFETCNFDTNDFEPTTGFDLFEELLDAFDSVQSEPVENTSNAANSFSDSPSFTSVFAPPTFSSSEAPGESPSFSSDSPPPPPASAQSTTGHNGNIYRIRSKLFTIIIIIAMVERSCWFKRRPLPPPPLLPPLPRPPPSPPPLPLPATPPPPPPQVSAPPIPSAAPSPAPAVMERLALVAAPARRVAGARHKSRRAKKRG